MAIKKYSIEEKQQIVNEAKLSGNILATAKKYSVSDKSIHNWMKKVPIKPSKDLNKEIKQLKRQLADAHLENSILKDLVKKTVQVWSHEDQSLMNTSPSSLQKLKY